MSELTDVGAGYENNGGPVRYDPTPLRNTIIIALGHKARHGKSWVAKHMQTLVPGAVVRGFADTLKAHCRIHYGMRRKDPTMLQNVASRLRETDPEIFIRALYDTLVEEPPPMVLIPDLRYENEARMIQQVGGFLVKVVRLQPGLEYTPYVSPDRNASHQSEVELERFTEWDRRIVAISEDLASLEKQSRVVLQQCIAAWVDRRTALAGEERVRAAAEDFAQHHVPSQYAPRYYFMGADGISTSDGRGPATRVSEPLRYASASADRPTPGESLGGDSNRRADVPGGDHRAAGGERGDHAGSVVQGAERGRVRGRRRVVSNAKRRVSQRRAGQKK